MKLKELEKRLDKEPDNLGLRVQVAGLMREAGRSVEAVELYRSVALAYRDQGRTQQAIMVCRSILEIAPEDAACQGLLGALQPVRATASPSQPPRSAAVSAQRAAVVPPEEPMRRSSLDETPLPRPVPHHVVDPTSQKYRLSESALHLPLSAGDRTPPPGNAVPRPMDLSAELDTRQRPKIPTEQLKKLDEVTALGEPDEAVITDQQARLSPMPRNSPAARLTPIPIGRDSAEDLLTEPHTALPRHSDEELTVPRERAKLFDEDD